MKKPTSAALRTIDLFSRKTKIEEVEDQLREEEIQEEERTARAYSDPTAMAEHAEETAIRWLGLDSFHEGDDVKVAVHPAGHAVLILVHTCGPNKAAYATQTLKLSRDQWKKLKSLVAFES